MHLRDLAPRLVKITGLIILVSAVTRVPGDFVWLLGGKANLNDWAVALMVFAPAAISVGVGRFSSSASIPSSIERCLLGRKPARRSRRICGPSRRSRSRCWARHPVDRPYRGHLVPGRSDLYYRAFKELPYGTPTFTPSDFGGFCASTLRFVIGISLMLGSHKFVALRRFLTSLRPMSDAS